VAAKLNGFEFTPGYPLRARVVAWTAKSGDKGGAKGGHATWWGSGWQGGGGAWEQWGNSWDAWQSGGGSWDVNQGGAWRSGKGDAASWRDVHGGSSHSAGSGSQGLPALEPAPSESLQLAVPAAPAPHESENTDYPVSNCAGAGRIEGWVVTVKSTIDDRRWGHVQSFAFKGNLLFRLEFSPLMEDREYQQKDSVTFDVVWTAQRRYEAVRLALEGEDGEIPDLEADGTGVAYPWAVVKPPPKAEEGGKGKGKGKEKGKTYVSAERLAGLLKPDRKAPADGKRDATWGNFDGNGVFFGGLNPSVTEDDLQTLAELVGTVTYVKIFMDTKTGVSRGCGKVFFLDSDMAERAIQELDKKEVQGRPITVERLGMEPRKKRKEMEQQQKNSDVANDIDEVPCLLPLSMFSEEDTAEKKMEICYAAFEDLIVSHDPASNGKGVVWMVRSLVREINNIFGEHSAPLQEFSYRLGKHPWFAENEQGLRWQASKGRMNISKVTPFQSKWMDENRQQQKGKGKGKGSVADPASAGRASFRTALPAQVEEYLEIPKHTKGKVMGVKGQQVAELRRQSGAQIDVDWGQRTGDLSTVKLVGTQEQVEAAKQLIARIVEPGPPCEDEFMEIPNNAMGQDPGDEGSLIQELEAEATVWQQQQQGHSAQWSI